MELQGIVNAINDQFKIDIEKNSKDAYYVRLTKKSDIGESIIRYISLIMIGPFTIYNIFKYLEYSSETKKFIGTGQIGGFSETVEGIVQKYISLLDIPDKIESLDDQVIWSINNIPANIIKNNLLKDKNYLTEQVIVIETKNDTFIRISDETGDDTDDTEDTKDTKDTNNNIYVDITIQFNGKIKVKRYDYPYNVEGIKNLTNLLLGAEQFLIVKKINFETDEKFEIWTLPTINLPEEYFIRSSLTEDLNKRCNQFQKIIRDKIKLLKSLPYVSDKDKKIQTPEEKILQKNFTNLVHTIWGELYTKFDNGDINISVGTFLEYYLQEYLNTIKHLEECIDPTALSFIPKDNVIHGPSINDVVSKTKCDKNKNIMLSVRLPLHSNLLIISPKDKKIYKLEPNIENTEDLTSVDPGADMLYTKYAKQSGYTYDGQWNSITCSLKHAGLCLFISHFSFIYGKNITNEILKDNIVNFFKWLLNKICNEQQECTIRSDLSNDEIVDILKNQPILNHYKENIEGLKKIVAFLLIVKISREHLEELIPLVITRVNTIVQKDEYSDITIMLNSVEFNKMKECLKPRIKIIMNRIKNIKYLPTECDIMNNISDKEIVEIIKPNKNKLVLKNLDNLIAYYLIIDEVPPTFINVLVQPKVNTESKETITRFMNTIKTSDFINRKKCLQNRINTIINYLL